MKWPKAEGPMRERIAHISGYKMSVWRLHPDGWAWGAWNAFDVIPAYRTSLSWHQAQRDAATWAKANASSGLCSVNGQLFPRVVRAIQFGHIRWFLADYGDSGLDILPPDTALRPHGSI